MSRGEVACRVVVEMLSDYLEAALPGKERAAFEQHLVLCEECATFLDQMRTTIDLTGRLPEEDVPDAVMATLMQVMKEGSA